MTESYILITYCHQPFRNRAILKNIDKHNLKQKLAECIIFMERNTSLGHIVTSEGTHIDPAKFTRNVRTFLGSMSMPSTIVGS